MKTELQNIILVSTSFERARQLDAKDEFVFNSEIEISHAFATGHMIVEFVYKALFTLNNDTNNENKISYSSKHVAQFRLNDFDSELEKDLADAARFANVNAAAMIFPFIRENAATISAKAGMSPIIIPVTNFVELYEEKLKKNKSTKSKTKKLPN